jgi:hypothetical protein
VVVVVVPSYHRAQLVKGKMNGAKRRAALDESARADSWRRQQRPLGACWQSNKSGANNMTWEIDKIISVANNLATTGETSASTGEQIAAAFVMNRMEWLPANYKDVVEAWDRLGDWQEFVRIVKRDYQASLVPW